MRVITGFHLMTSSADLQRETRLLPVEVHLRMLCQQFTASALRPSHVSFPIVSSPVHQPRVGTHQELKDPPKTLRSAYLEAVSDFLTNGVMGEDDYKPAIRAIHTRTVRTTIQNNGANRVLGINPPPVHKSEARLPRDWRCVLAQLRSGFCKLLLSFLNRIGKSRSSTCPHCNSLPDTTSHLFSCPSFPTPLRPIDLWLRPCKAALFLSNSPTFAHLPDIDPPPPRPPPAPSW